MRIALSIVSLRSPKIDSVVRGHVRVNNWLPVFRDPA